VRTLAEEEVDEINRRSPEQWDAAAAATMSRIRRAALPGRRRRSLRWAVGIAASLLVLALVIPRHRVSPQAPAAPAADASGLSAADREDDRLLRDVAFLAQGDDASAGLSPDDSL
jgi:hypothetical protein